MPWSRDGYHEIRANIPDALHKRMLLVAEKTGQPISSMMLEAVLARYGKDLQPGTDELLGYIPPPVDEDFKWCNERDKALLDHLGKEIIHRSRELNRVLSKHMHKQELSIADQVEIMELSKLRPEKPTKQFIREWDEETRRRFENPTGRELARRYLHQLVKTIDWLRKNNALEELASMYYDECDAGHFDGHTHCGKAAMHYLRKASEVVWRWRNSTRFRKIADI